MDENVENYTATVSYSFPHSDSIQWFDNLVISKEMLGLSFEELMKLKFEGNKKAELLLKFCLRINEEINNGK